MISVTEYEARWDPTVHSAERGQVTLLVARIGGGVHETPETAVLDVERGFIGDRWERGKAVLDCQLTLMMHSVAALVCGDKPLHLPGDNLLVDLDLRNLEPGTELEVGDAIVVITEEPHTGCAKFSERFGSEALKWVNGRSGRDRNLRGVNARVIRGGQIAVGSEITVRPKSR